MTIWFTADTHFHHANIITYCNRPYASVEEMDEALIKNWNDNVRPKDTIYVLGDFVFNRHPDHYLTRLHGRKILIVGNHDSKSDASWMSVYDYRLIQHNKQRFVLMHYPIESWLPGAIHLHGHSHGQMRQVPNRYDVGVDVRDYLPVSIEEITTWL